MVTNDLSPDRRDELSRLVRQPAFRRKFLGRPIRPRPMPIERPDRRLLPPQEELPDFLKGSPFLRQNQAFLPPKFARARTLPDFSQSIGEPFDPTRPILGKGGRNRVADPRPDIPDFLSGTVRPTGSGELATTNRAVGDVPGGGPEVLPPPGQDDDDDGELDFGSFLETGVEGQRAAFQAFLEPFATTGGRKQALDGLFRDVRNEFLGELGTQVLDDGAPTLKFADFLKDQPLAKRLLQQANVFEGQNTRQLAPQTRTLFGF